MSFDEFLTRVRGAAGTSRRLVPVWRDVLLDTETPVAAFAKLRQGPFAFLLESAPARGVAGARVDIGAADGELRSAHDAALRTVDATIARLRGPAALQPHTLDPTAKPAEGTSVYDKEQFIKDVERVRQYVIAGDAF